MRQANFIVGFSNWSKSTVIQALFQRQTFNISKTYEIDALANNIFSVQSQSNDDIGSKYITQITERLQNANKKNPDLFTTLCPSREVNNNYLSIITDPVFAPFERLNFFLLQYKWDHHAELIINNITSELSQVENAFPYVIDADRHLPVEERTAAKVQQIINTLITINIPIVQ